MCKVLMISGIKPENNANAIRFMKVMGTLMSTNNTDGLGYSATDKDGNLFGERWHKNADAFSVAKPVVNNSERKKQLLGKLEPASKKNNYYSHSTRGQYNNYGVVDLTKMVAVTLHTRFATSGKEFANTHPFYDPDADTSLIHNGVIRNDKDFDLKLSTCDSESILISYVNNKVAASPESIQTVSNELIGYYACGVLARDANGKRILDIFKGNGASLHCAWVENLETFVFSTSAFDIKEACEKLNFTYTDMLEINEGFLIRSDIVTGELQHIETFTVGNEYTYSPKSQTRTTTPGGTNTLNVSTVPNLPATVTELHRNRTPRGHTDEMIQYLSLKPHALMYSITELMMFSASHFLFGETGEAI